MKEIFEARSCLSRGEIRQYLRQELNHDQRRSVEQHLIDCPLCADAVEGLDWAEQSGQLAEELNSVRLASFPQPQRASRRVWFNRAAAVLLLLMGIYSVLQYRAATVEERLFWSFFEAEQPEYFALRSAYDRNHTANRPELKAALEFYRGERFEYSLPHFERHLEAHPEDEEAYFLFATALLGAEQTERAKHMLQQLRQGQAEIERGRILWYLALAHLRSKEVDLARSLLEDIPASSGNSFNAKSLQNRLQKID